MTSDSIEAIVRALNDADVRYLVVGGLAVVAHGYVRLTVDLDLILDLQEPNLRRAISALAGLGYRPRAPVELNEFIDPRRRAQWAREKGLTVFSLFSSEHKTTEVDLFVENPIDFERAYAESFLAEVVPGVSATFIGLKDLLYLKRQAGRPKDLEDVRRLETLDEEQSDG